MGFCSNGFKTSCIASHLHYNNVLCIQMCVYFVAMIVFCQVWVGLSPRCILSLHVTCSCIRTFNLLYSSILCCWCFTESTLSQNPLHFGASISSSFDPTPSHVQFYDEKARKDFLENFCRRGIHPERQVLLLDFSDIDLPTVIYSRGWESLRGIPVICPFVIIQEFYSNMHGIDTSIPHFFSHIRGTRIVVTLEIVSKVLHVPRVAHPDYPGCDRLRTVSKDELSSLFCETPSSQGNCQNTPCSAFAKGPRFLNMVMTFILHPLSHYNTITKPRARFLLSHLEDISIDFPSHFVLSLIDVFRDMVTRDKLIFPLAIMWLLCHFSVSYLEFPYFLVMQLPFDGERHNSDRGGPGQRRLLLLLPPLHPPHLLHLLWVE